jgi:hypothetical protein
MGAADGLGSTEEHLSYAQMERRIDLRHRPPRAA